MNAARSQQPMGHLLSTLLEGIATARPDCERDILGLSTDSRSLRPGDLFLACAGSHRHGGEFIEQAIKAGAVAIVRETAYDARIESSGKLAAPIIGVAELSRHLGLIAARFYGHPSRDLFMTGVTGTNGKTSVCHFLAQALSGATNDNVAPCALIGTLGNGFYGALETAAHTTPDAVTLQKLLAELHARGARGVAMEASSHGLAQGRVNGVEFDLALFTNLSRDHLDYHSDMQAYGAAKRRLFEMPGLRYAVVNADDAYGRELLAILPNGVRALAYGFAKPAACDYVQGRALKLSASGLEMQVSTPWGAGQLRSTLLGQFNASNVLATLAALLLMDIPLEDALERLARTRTVSGRMERIGGRDGQPTVVVDYAHTPDALEKVLLALRAHLPPGAKLWCVFGCGGERDRGKRPLMGALAERYADAVIVTHDNPRHEEASGIIAAILGGMTRPERVCVLPARGAAIAHAVQSAAAQDLVLIAGKGHEDYQIIGAERLPFSDRDEAHVALAQRVSQ